MFKHRKRIFGILAVVMLLSVLCVNAFAYGMGGASIGTKGVGSIWNDQNSPHKLCGETTANSGYSNVGIRVRIEYKDTYGYTGNAYDPTSTTYKESSGTYVSTCVSMPSSYTPKTGYGYYKVDGSTNSSSREWNFG